MKLILTILSESLDGNVLFLGWHPLGSAGLQRGRNRSERRYIGQLHGVISRLCV